MVDNETKICPTLNIYKQLIHQTAILYFFLDNTAGAVSKQVGSIDEIYSS